MTTRIPTYGGWRRARGIGLFGLGAAQTFVVLAVIAGLLLAGSFDTTLMVYLIVPALLIVGLTVAKVGGVPLMDLAVRRVSWWWAVTRGQTRYRGGGVREHPEAWLPPGVLSATTLLSAEDGLGGHYGLIWNRQTGLMTATLRCAAASTWLAERGDSDSWVSSWGGWLASLGHLPVVRWVAVTVDTAPDPGSTLADRVEANISLTASPQARRLMAELVRVSPAAAADVDTRVSITFDLGAAAHKPKTIDQAVAEVTRLLPGLQSGLTGCGLTILGRATADELVGVVRAAYDPEARGETNRFGTDSPLHRPGTPDLVWSDAGPVSADEYWDHYRHDSGVSVTWTWHEAPRQHVHSDVLARLLAPGRFPKRVTLLYRPLPAGPATKLLEREVNAADFREAYRHAQGRDESARDHADRARAQQAAVEEALGAGVCLMSMFVTATVNDMAYMGEAVADIETRAESARVRLRRMYASQATGFATTLPCGVHPTALRARRSTWGKS